VATWLERGLALIGRGEFFAAHEELELAWRAAAPAERDFFQGLVHVAVAWYQATRDNATGCGRQLEKATRRLTPYAPRHREIALEGLLSQLDAARRTVASGSLVIPPPRLERTL
jgi:predicted metal-dependent hydrolase